MIAANEADKARAAAQNRFRNRIVGDGEESPEQLLANPRNARIHSQLQQRIMLGSLRELGWLDRVKVNKATGFVVDGHMRIALAISEGEQVIPVSYLDLTPQEELLALVTFDPIAALASYDKEQLEENASEARASNDGLNELLARLKQEARKGEADRPTSDATPEFRISPELHERQDYLVFVFVNELDWRAACTAFDVGSAYEKDPADVRQGATSANKGLGRVLWGADLVAKLRAAAGAVA